MANGPRRREHLDLCEILMVLWSWFQLGQGERTPQSCSVGEDQSVDPKRFKTGYRFIYWNILINMFI